MRHRLGLERTTVFVALVFSFFGVFRALAQDQISAYGKVFEGKVVGVDAHFLKLKHIDGSSKNFALDNVDSLYVSRLDSVFAIHLRGKLSARPLLNITQGAMDEELATFTEREMLARVAQIEERQKREIADMKYTMYESGRSISGAGVAFLTGAILSIGGAVISVVQDVKIGTVVGLGGTVFTFIGYGRLISAGKHMRGAMAKNVELGMGSNGVGLVIYF